MLVGLPILAGEERAAWARPVAPLAPRPTAVISTGLAADDRAQRSGTSLEATTEDFAIELANGPDCRSMPNAALDYASERLRLVEQPALLVRKKDPLWEASLRATAWMHDLKVLDLPDYGSDIFRSAPSVIAGHLRSFLDRGS